MFQPLACFETCWILLSKSSCRALVWKWKLMMEVFQSLFEWLDSFYMMYRWCLKWKFRKRTSGFEVGFLKLKMCTNGVFLVILGLGCFWGEWKWWTTSKWCLEYVLKVGFHINCKGWRIRRNGFLELKNKNKVAILTLRDWEVFRLWIDYELVSMNIRNDLYL